MKRSVHGPALILILLGFGASFVGTTPRSESQPGSPVIPAATLTPGWSESRVAASGNTAETQSKAPGSKASEQPNGTAAMTSLGPRSAHLPAKASPAPTPKPSVRKEVPSARLSKPGTNGRSVARPGGQTGALSGLASWYCLAGRSACTNGYGPGCFCAAAGPVIRAALGDWRGQSVTVSTGRAAVRVRLIDFCACGNRLLDLYGYPFSGLAPLSAGLVNVEVSW